MPEKNPRRRTRQQGLRRRVPSNVQRDPMLSDLSPQQAKLVRLLQLLNFGTISDLRVCNGEPCCEPRPRILESVKFPAKDEDARPELGIEDFPLRQEILDLLDSLVRLGDGTVLSLEVRHGLPFRMLIEKRVPTRFIG